MDYKRCASILVQNALYRIRLERSCFENGTWRSDAGCTLTYEATMLIEDGSSYDPDALYQIRTVIDLALSAPASAISVEMRAYLAVLVKEMRYVTANYKSKFDRDVSLVPTMRTLTADFSKQIKRLTGA
jgi:hypothetical protein